MDEHGRSPREVSPRVDDVSPMSNEEDPSLPPRSSTEKPRIDTDEDDEEALPTAFERLPDEIIQQILQVTDSSGFASLTLLNSKWRSIAQQAHLYALHLSNCPSYGMSHNQLPEIITDDVLPELRRLFAREVKRNLFEAYLRPNQTVIKMISTSNSSSSCPGGEGIQFSPSPKGHHLLAYNSSRIYVVDVRGPDIEVKRELKILRRPVSTCIKDDGSLLAVLLTDMQVDIYDLEQTPPKRAQSLILDNCPRAIALSPCGSVLAAAYEGGIEVSSLNPGALPTDRRSVKCDGVDALAFSFDGTQILGTTVHSSQPNTVILTAPYYDPGTHMGEEGVNEISALWTTSILFPNTSRDCSHAVFIQDGMEEEAGWTFTYDRSFETFRAVRIGDLRNGTTYFSGPIPSPESQVKLIPCTLPAASYHGELVAAAFQGKEIWLYGVLEDLDAVPVCNVARQESGGSVSSLRRRNSAPSTRPSPGRSRDNDGEPKRVPQWQIVCDKLRNAFVGGYKIGELEGVTTVKWVADFENSPLKERLVVAARGVTPHRLVTEEEGMDFEDGGRITLLDFDYRVKNGEVKEIVIEVGTKEPEVLEEEHRDMDAEVAIVRRRTMTQKGGGRDGLGRAHKTESRVPPLPLQMSSLAHAQDQSEGNDDEDPLVPRRIRSTLPIPQQPEELPAAKNPEEDADAPTIEEQEAMESPYAHASPRSGTTLRRAATAAANSRLNPVANRQTRYEYRRADGRAEHPHESDADNWIPPPPPYQKDDPGEAPAFLRHGVNPVVVPNVLLVETKRKKHQSQLYPSATPPLSQPTPPMRSRSVVGPLFGTGIPPVPPLPMDVPPVPLLSPTHRAQLTVLPTNTHQRSLSTPLADPPSRPRTSDSRYLDGENIYDVSPPESPARTPALPLVTPEFGESRTANSTSVTGSGSSIAAVPRDTHSQVSASNSSPQRTVSAATSPIDASHHLPNLSVQIPATVSHSTGPQSTMDPSLVEPDSRRLSSASTWPLQPQSQFPPSQMQVTGHPYSAPATQWNANIPSGMAYPAPRPDQLARLSHRTNVPPRRLSGGYGNRGSDDWSNTNRSSYSGRSTSHLSRDTEHDRSVPPLPPEVSRHHYRPSNMCIPVLPAEDRPLIISTPKGVQGGFDLPLGTTCYQQQHRPDPTILAPIPRHPRPQTQAAVLRPTVERLETIYSVASATAESSSHQQRQQEICQATQPARMLHLSAPPPNRGSGSTTPLGSVVGRVPSVISHRPSRADRSAAKKLADAKKTGWTVRRRSTRRRNNKGAGEGSSGNAAELEAAWADLTPGVAVNLKRRASVMLGAGIGMGLDREAARPKRAEAAAAVGREEGKGKGNGKGGKCVIM